MSMHSVPALESSRFMVVIIALTATLLSILVPNPTFATSPSQGSLRVGVLENPFVKRSQHLNPVGLYSASQSTSWNKIVSDGWFLPLAGPFGTRGDFLPIGTTMLTTQAHMKQERHPSNLFRYVTVTIPLRRDVSWSDGSPLRAEDVVFTYQALQQLNVATLGGNWHVLFPDDLLHSVEALDPHTVKFWLTRLPGLGEWQFGLLAVPIMKKSVWKSDLTAALEQENPAAYFARLPMHPIVLGPRVPEEINHDQIRSVPNPNDIRQYERVVLFQSGATALSNTRSRFLFRSNGAQGIVSQVIEDSAPLSSLIFRPYNSRTEAQQALVQGDIDLVLDPFNQWHPDSVGLRVLAFNLQRPPTATSALRRALAELTDRNTLIEFIQTQSPLPVPVLSSTHTLIPPIHGAWHHPFVGHDGPPLSPDLRQKRAQRILADAGYRPENLVPSGNRLTIVTPTAESDPISHAVARYIGDLLDQLNIPGEIIAIPRDDFYARVFGQRDFDLAVIGWRVEGGTFPHQLDLLFASESGEWNITGYDSPEYQEVVHQLRQAPDLITAQRAAWTLQEILYEDVPIIPLMTIGPAPAKESRQIWSSLMPRHNTIWMD